MMFVLRDRPLLKIVEGAHGYSELKTMSNRKNNMKKTVVPSDPKMEPAEGAPNDPKKPRRAKKSFSAKSAYLNVVIEARFDTIFPHLIELNKLDLTDHLIDVFGEKHLNHLGLFLAHGVEEHAMYCLFQNVLIV
jgi:hypothetical protein